jgi:hypothetical protein
MSWNKASFKKKLEDQHHFPSLYMFKFIVPAEKEQAVLDLLPKGDLSFKKSAQNTYVSITLKKEMDSSNAVLKVYEDVYQVPGVMAL